MSLSGCGEPSFPAWQVTMEEVPGVIYRFSSADATSSSPIVMTVEGREPTDTDQRLRTRLIRKWVAFHAPPDGTMVAWASAMCGEKRKEGEFPGCDIFIINDPTTGKEVDYYFYAGNWPVGRMSK
jgi:hypothetical protein